MDGSRRAPQSHRTPRRTLSGAPSAVASGAHGEGRVTVGRSPSVLDAGSGLYDEVGGALGN